MTALQNPYRMQIFVVFKKVRKMVYKNVYNAHVFIYVYTV